MPSGVQFVLFPDPVGRYGPVVLAWRRSKRTGPLEPPAQTIARLASVERAEKKFTVTRIKTAMSLTAFSRRQDASRDAPPLPCAQCVPRGPPAARSRGEGTCANCHRQSNQGRSTSRSYHHLVGAEHAAVGIRPLQLVSRAVPQRPEDIGEGPQRALDQSMAQGVDQDESDGTSTSSYFRMTSR
jgi:hypothetical protein